MDEVDYSDYAATSQFHDKMDAIEVFIRDTVLAAMGPTGMGCPFGSGTVTVRTIFLKPSRRFSLE